MYQVITRALYGTIQNLLCKYIFIQTKYSPWSCLLMLSYSTDTSLLHLPVLILFAYFCVLDLITSKAVKNVKEWIYTHLLQVIHCIFIFFSLSVMKRELWKSSRVEVSVAVTTGLCYKDAMELLNSVIWSPFQQCAD